MDVTFTLSKKKANTLSGLLGIAMSQLEGDAAADAREVKGILDDQLSAQISSKYSCGPALYDEWDVTRGPHSAL